MNQELYANGFLGIDVVRLNSNNKVTLIQTRITDQIVKDLGLQEAKCYSTYTPAEYGSFPLDQDGDPCSEAFNYSSVVGILFYLAGNYRMYIAFDVHQCAMCTFFPKPIHDKALKRIGCYK